MPPDTQAFIQNIDSLYELLVQKRQTYVGYPNSQLLENTPLARFLDIPINNVGDPFIGNNGMNTFDFEKEVVDFFCHSLHLEEGWGYITNGGTESNLFGLYIAREAHPNGVVFFSEETHYSLPKAVRILGLKHAVVNCLPNGEMDYAHFARMVRGLRHYPIIVNANIGTTMKGAIDDIDKILSVLESMSIENFYIHCDAALFGGMLPFIRNAPVFDFRKPIGSVAISGHKFIGSPIPSGVVCVRRPLKERVAKAVEYIGSKDATISGSRDGFAVLVLWSALKRMGRMGLESLVHSCFDTAEFAVNELVRIGWGGWRNSFSNIVVFRKPSDPLTRKWHLATQDEYSHLVCMPGVTHQQVRDLVTDLEKELNRKLQPNVEVA